MKTYPLEITEDLVEQLKRLDNASDILSIFCKEWHSFPDTCSDCNQCAFNTKEI